MKTILITGCSSGYGLATAKRFHAEGWRVVATMRTPAPDLLPQSEHMCVMQMDVTKADSIAAVLAACGPIDVLVNNAGIGYFGAFEAAPMHIVREIFETNTFGVMAVTQAVVPQLRERGAGLVINVTSSATLAPFPLVAAYTASKTAIQGFSASLAHELGEFGVGVKIVAPGYGPGTQFASNGSARMAGSLPEAYVEFAQRAFASLSQPGQVTTPDDVASIVWDAANDGQDRLLYPAGPDAVALAAKRVH
ncbi:MAG TPA: SDR family oxidoreductase [Telluria sp.]|jgi:NAD(P)-dependent dehydrogenase (short-subunit alcohol dehydrogenase family)